MSAIDFEQAAGELVARKHWRLVRELRAFAIVVPELAGQKVAAVAMRGAPLGPALLLSPTLTDEEVDVAADQAALWLAVGKAYVSLPHQEIRELVDGWRSRGELDLLAALARPTGGAQ